jgi:hypothetical protein
LATDAELVEVETAEATAETLWLEFRRSHGGVVGTGGRAAVAFRFDHWLNTFGQVVLPLLTERGFPSGLCLYSGMFAGVWADADSDDYTPANVADWCVDDGVELWCHSRSHTWDSDWGSTELDAEIAGSKAALEAALGARVKVQGWMQPGNETNPTYDGFDLTDVSSFYTSGAGRLLRSTYPVCETDAQGRFRPLDGTGSTRLGGGHLTVDTLNYAECAEAVDHAVAHGLGVELMLHAGLLDTPGHITTADYTALLDYVAGLQLAGDLVVLTPSSLHLADKHSDHRAELIAGGFGDSFDPDDNPGLWSSTAGLTVIDDGDRNVWLRVTGPSTVFSQGNAYVGQRGHAGETFCVEARFRRVADAAVTARIQLVDDQDWDNWTDNRTLPIGSGAGEWFRFVFTVPANTDYVRAYFGRSSGGSVDVTGCRLYKV